MNKEKILSIANDFVSELLSKGVEIDNKEKMKIFSVNKEKLFSINFREDTIKGGDKFHNFVKMNIAKSDIAYDLREYLGLDEKRGFLPHGEWFTMKDRIIEFVDNI